MSLWVPQGTTGNNQLRKVAMILPKKPLKSCNKKGETCETNKIK